MSDLLTSFDSDLNDGPETSHILQQNHMAGGGCHVYLFNTHKKSIILMCSVQSSDVRWMRRAFSQCWVQYWCLWDHLLLELQYELACNSSPHWLQARSIACEWRKMSFFYQFQWQKLMFPFRGNSCPLKLIYRCNLFNLCKGKIVSPY